MSNSGPLQEGQEVFLKRPVQIYAKVIGPREGYLGLPEDQVYYAIRLMPLEQYYLPEDLELANWLQPINPSLNSGSPQSAREPGRYSEAVFNLSTGDAFLELAREINDMVACRAYELYEARGFTDGRDAEDWFRAVSETLLKVPADITETDGQLTIRADVPGVSATDLEVQVTPQSVCIIGKRPLPAEQSEEKPVYSERRSNRIFRVLDLPCEIDPYGVAGSIGGGILEIKLPKTASRDMFAAQAQVASV